MTNGSTPNFNISLVYQVLALIIPILQYQSERLCAVNKIHKHFKNLFPSFTGLDFPMETNVDISMLIVMHFIVVVLLIFMQKEVVANQLLIFQM